MFFTKEYISKNFNINEDIADDIIQSAWKSALEAYNLEGSIEIHLTPEGEISVDIINNSLSTGKIGVVEYVHSMIVFNYMYSRIECLVDIHKNISRRSIRVSNILDIPVNVTPKPGSLYWLIINTGSVEISHVLDLGTMCAFLLDKSGNVLTILSSVDTEDSTLLRLVENKSDNPAFDYLQTPFIYDKDAFQLLQAIAVSTKHLFNKINIKLEDIHVDIHLSVRNLN